jgi:hypothetical protein
MGGVTVQAQNLKTRRSLRTVAECTEEPRKMKVASLP